MELIDVIATAHFTDTRIGSVARKQRMRLPVILAEQLESIGLVTILNPQKTVVKMPQPTEPRHAGGDKLSVSSPVAQALPKKIATESSEQASKPSQSTTVGAEQDSQTQSMPVTDSGGESTTKRLKKGSAVSAGRKTTTAQKSTN